MEDMDFENRIVAPEYMDNDSDVEDDSDEE